MFRKKASMAVSAPIITLNGETLSLAEIEQLCTNTAVKVEISPLVLPRLEKTRSFIDEQVAHKVVYGINTGFGPMSSYIIGNEDLFALQKNLIRSHAVGMGEPIKDSYSLIAMVIRLNTLLRGYSGASLELLKILSTFINHRILPVIPEHGAVGTSGDLVQLAHIALALQGEGEVVYQGKRQKTADVLTHLHLTPYEFKPKEGLAIINGTSVMTAVAAVLCLEARNLVFAAIKNAAFALEVIHGFSDSISIKLQELRPHHGQSKVAEIMRQITASSKLLKDRKEFQARFGVTKDHQKITEEVQDVYSFRCSPQILGPIYDTLLDTEKTVEVEMNSVTDNPLIDCEEETFIHGGNFHGDYIASRIDFLKIALIKMTMLSERRTNFFLNQKINATFPPFLNLKKPGLTLGLQALQFVATSTTADNQSLGFPHHLHSISTNADNQDVVSMGTDAALFAEKVIANAGIVLAIELITLTQAVDYLQNRGELSSTSADYYDGLRQCFPAIIDDRVLSSELPLVLDYLRHTKHELLVK